MEAISVETGASADVVPSEEHPVESETEDKKKGSRFSRRKEKKKAAKKAKKAAKHSKDKGQPDVSPDAEGSLTVEKDVEDASADVLRGALEAQSDTTSLQKERHKSAFTPYHRQHVRSESAEQDRGALDSSLRHSLASGASSAGSELVSNENSSSLSGQQLPESEHADASRAKSRSRSGSRKRLPALFRRRGRSRGKDDEPLKSGTEVVGGGVEGMAGVATQNGSSGEKKSRKSKSLDRAKARHSASMDRYAARQTASLERDAYRRFDPAKQPRDRLQHMTVKDALLEYRYRHQPPSNRLLTVDNSEVEGQGQRSVSDTDVSFRNHEGEGRDLPLDPDQETLVKSVATLPRGSRLVRETSLLGGSDEEPADSSELGTGEDGSFPRRNLGKQILDMCRTMNGDPELDRTDGGGRSQGHSDTHPSAHVHRTHSDHSRDASSIIFINPNDIQADTSCSSSDVIQHSDSADAPRSQQKVKPSDSFMELRKAVPIYSKSTTAKERRVSPAEAAHVPHDDRSSQSRDSSKSDDVPLASSLSKGVSSTQPNNIPQSDSGDSRAMDSTLRCGLPSPEITVNCAQNDETCVDAALKMDSSVTMDASMISSIDSGKRSSDQGFFSEPRESDSDSDIEMSGFSTPPEELYSEHDSARNSLSPTVFVNNVNNLLEVPKARSPYKRSVSDDVRKAPAAGTSSASSGVNRTHSFKSDSVLTKRKPKQPAPSSLEGSKLYLHHKEELRPAKDGAQEQQMNQERMDQKNVPVMGTSVQQKYRRTFSPSRIKTGEASKEEGIGSVPSDTEPTTVVALSEQSKPAKTLLALPGSQSTRDESKLSGEDTEKSKLQRGKGSLKHRGYVSGRSFRRKKDTENKDPETMVKDPRKPETPTAEVIDDGVEELQHRIAFQDKSIQTSDSLLNELIKKSKKRKLKPFSSAGKKSKQEDRHPVAVQIPADLPPPKYEEERPLREAAHSDISPVEEQAQPPVTSSSDVTDGLLKEEEEDPEIAPLLDSGEASEAEEQQPAVTKPPKASKSRSSSFRALVALKRKLTRNRQKKKKQLNDQTKEAEEGEEEEEAEKGENTGLPSDTFITIENELNLSKLAEIKETDILDDEIIEPGFGPVFPNKELRFEPILSDEPIQSEEPLPPLSPATRRMTARRNSTRGRERRKKCLHCCKKFIAFLFSHIGLCSLVVGYTIFGGFIFKLLEGKYEIKVRNEVKEERVKVMKEIKTLATEYQLNELALDQMTTELEKLLKNYQTKLFTEITDKGWDGNDYDPNAENQSEQWSFASALLYAITVMTTIGYGHVAPKTPYGRVVTIFYAVLGIPLTLLCLTNIGDVMASGFRLLYGKVCCGLCCKLFKPSRRRRRRVPDVEKGLPRQVVTTEEGEADKPKEVIQVPTSLCLLLIATYIFAGSLLFSLWEDWDFLTGSYFCFITLSTIGFGDIVPGMDVQSWSKEYKLVLSALYLIFGLSLIAMCFNLVQEDVKAKCRWLGMKIGIIDKPEPPV